MLRYLPLIIIVVASLAAGVATIYWSGMIWALIPLSGLALLGLYDLAQRGHSLLRNYPVLGHLRWLFEGIRPEIRQYLIESNQDEVPFSREKRSLVYQRAKGDEDRRPFGTQRDVYEPGYAWLTHSLAPKAHIDSNFRIKVGGSACSQPYDASVLNISAMSFGALSSNAIEALNAGARLAGFTHNTGEGGLSRYHRLHGGDLTWQIGSGYFGCRDSKGGFDVGGFAENAQDDQVKMIEVKLSQGAKPGHGGVLPGRKVSPEIAEARGVAAGEDCISPAAHTAFSTPTELMNFLQLLREKSGGKPVGFKLCIGHYSEFAALVKAMLETGVRPDFITIDGKEGGTGAAPLEFVNRIGTPMAEGLTYARNVLIGAGLRDDIKLAAAGKIITAFDIVWARALGADWCNVARGFMFALGCIQAQSCHSNRCPTGITTQDPVRKRALVVGDKAERVANFHTNTLKALAEIVAAAGFDHPGQIQPWHLMIRQNNGEVLPADKAFPLLKPGELVEGACTIKAYATPWRLATAASFSPMG